MGWARQIDAYCERLGPEFWAEPVNAVTNAGFVLVGVTALAIVCFPARSIGFEVLRDITRGAADKLREAGAVLAGGHSVVDPQPKFGLSVTGLVRPDEMMDNAHARPGDALVLTKPLGTGVTIMAAKAGMVGREEEREANRTMSALNGTAASTYQWPGAAATRACQSMRSSTSLPPSSTLK